MMVNSAQPGVEGGGGATPITPLPFLLCWVTTKSWPGSWNCLFQKMYTSLIHCYDIIVLLWYKICRCLRQISYFLLSCGFFLSKSCRQITVKKRRELVQIVLNISDCIELKHYLKHHKLGLSSKKPVAEYWHYTLFVREYVFDPVNMSKYNT
jgi:hypothetical protein